MSDYFNKPDSGQAQTATDPYQRLSSTAANTGRGHVGGQQQGWLDAYGQQESKSWSDYYDQYRKHFSGKQPEGYGAMMEGQSGMSPGSTQYQWMMNAQQRQFEDMLKQITDSQQGKFDDDYANFMREYWDREDARQQGYYDFIKGLAGPTPGADAGPTPGADAGLAPGEGRQFAGYDYADAIGAIYSKYGVTPGDSDLAYWAGMFQSGGGNLNDLNWHLGTTKQIGDLYAKYGQPAPTGGDLDYWINHLGGGGSLGDLEYQLWTNYGGGGQQASNPDSQPTPQPTPQPQPDKSAEIRSIYQKYGLQPTASDLSYWAGQDIGALDWQLGATRDINNMYIKYGVGVPAAGDRDYWLNYLGSGGNMRDFEYQLWRNHAAHKYFYPSNTDPHYALNREGVRAYLARYPELTQYFNTHGPSGQRYQTLEDFARWHWVNHGKKEGRIV